MKRRWSAGLCAVLCLGYLLLSPGQAKAIGKDQPSDYSPLHYWAPALSRLAYVHRHHGPILHRQRTPVVSSPVTTPYPTTIKHVEVGNHRKVK